jgi:hypothetical protein
VFDDTLSGERSPLRGNRFLAPSAYRQHRELAEQAHALAGEVGPRQAARQLGIHRETLKAAFAQWDLLALQRRVGWQPSRFLTDRAEAQRAYQLAARLGSVNAAAAELGTTWPSLRKAFQRHGLGMPARNPEAVRQRASAAASQHADPPPAPPLDPVFVALNPGQLPTRRGPQAELGVRLRRAEEIETLSYRTVVELNAESRLAPQRRVATIAGRPQRAQRLAQERAGRIDRRQAERASRTDRPHQPLEERGMVADAR